MLISGDIHIERIELCGIEEGGGGGCLICFEAFQDRGNSFDVITCITSTASLMSGIQEYLSYANIKTPQGQTKCQQTQLTPKISN